MYITVDEKYTNFSVVFSYLIINELGGRRLDKLYVYLNGSYTVLTFKALPQLNFKNNIIENTKIGLLDVECKQPYHIYQY